MLVHKVTWIAHTICRQYLAELTISIIKQLIPYSNNDSVKNVRYPMVGKQIVYQGDSCLRIVKK